MSQISGESLDFPVRTRWLHASRDLSRPNSIHQHANRALMCSERPPKGHLLSPHIASAQICRRPQAGIPPIIEIGANIKSP
jgi:hypothetical protein